MEMATGTHYIGWWGVGWCKANVDFVETRKTLPLYRIEPSLFNRRLARNLVCSLPYSQEPPLVPILNHINPDHSLLAYYFNFNVLPFMPMFS